MFRLWLYIFFLVITSSIFFGNKAYANSEEIRDDSLIKRICLGRYRYEMKTAKLIPSEKIGNFTCDCFLSKIERGASINSAQSQCKKEASVKFDPIIKDKLN